MRFQELMEYGGRHGFPGYGRKLFSAKAYIETSYQIAKVRDQHVKDFLVDFFVEAFSKDNDKFNPKVFREACADGSKYTNVDLQQRHFYYLAHQIKNIEDPNAREYVANWSSKWLNHTNVQFQFGRWMRECGVEDAK